MTWLIEKSVYSSASFTRIIIYEEIVCVCGFWCHQDGSIFKTKPSCVPSRLRAPYNTCWKLCFMTKSLHRMLSLSRSGEMPTTSALILVKLKLSFTLTCSAICLLATVLREILQRVIISSSCSLVTMTTHLYVRRDQISPWKCFLDRPHYAERNSHKLCSKTQTSLA